MDPGTWDRREPERLWVYGVTFPVLGILAILGRASYAPAHHWVTLVTVALAIVVGVEFARAETKEPERSGRQ